MTPSDQDPVELTLERLRAGTEALGPRRDFAQRVLAGLASSPQELRMQSLLRSARWWLPAALAMALLAVGMAVQTEAQYSQELATAAGLSEVEE